MLPPGGRDRGSYRDQRRREAGRANARAADDPEKEEMFFGASPTEKKELRQTPDKRAVKLDDLDMNAALDRDRLGAPEQVGEAKRLIDIAMEDAEGTEPAVRPAPRPEDPPRPTRQRKRPPRPKKKKPAPKTGKRGGISKFFRRPSAAVQAALATEDRPAGPAGAAPTGEAVEGLRRPSRLWQALLALLIAAGAAFPYGLEALRPERAAAAARVYGHDLGRLVAWARSADAPPLAEAPLADPILAAWAEAGARAGDPGEVDGLTRALGWGRPGLIGLALLLGWLGALRRAVRPRGGFGREVGRALALGGLPAAALGFAAYVAVAARPDLAGALAPAADVVRLPAPCLVAAALAGVGFVLALGLRLTRAWPTVADADAV